MNQENKIKFNSPLLKDFNPQEYEFLGLWKNDVFSSSFWEECLNQDLLRKVGFEIDETGVVSLCAGNYLVKKSVSEKINSQLRKHILSGDQHFFSNFKNIADSVAKEVVSYGDSINQEDVSFETVSKFFNELRKLNFLWYLGATHVSKMAEDVLSDFVIAEKFPAELVPYIIPKVVTPLTHQNKEILLLKKLVGDKTLDEVKQDKTLLSKLEDHVKEYFWIEIINFTGNILTTDRLYEQIIHTKDVGHIEPPVLLKISDKLKFAAECMHVCGYVKQNSAEHFSIISAKAYDFLHNIAKKLDLEYRQFTMLTPEEILGGLRGEIAKDILRERSIKRQDFQWFLFLGKEGYCVVVDDKEDIETLKNIMLPKFDEKATEVKGVVAYSGKVRGTARVIMNLDEFDKMKTGDVLISTMTTPDFVILMQQASAIVTDIGGVLCHAAIVSREIHKPCVIGTKNATKVFKDGDMIEVDAEKGIVKIIK